jgi:hypothetical protein
VNSFPKQRTAGHFLTACLTQGDNRKIARGQCNLLRVSVISFESTFESGVGSICRLDLSARSCKVGSFLIGASLSSPEHSGIRVPRITGLPRQTKDLTKPIPLDGTLAAALLDWSLQTPYRQLGDWVFASRKLNGKQPYWPELLKCYVRPAAKGLGIT